MNERITRRKYKENKKGNPRVHINGPAGGLLLGVVTVVLASSILPRKSPTRPFDRRIADMLWELDQASFPHKTRWPLFALLHRSARVDRLGRASSFCRGGAPGGRCARRLDALHTQMRSTLPNGSIARSPVVVCIRRATSVPVPLPTRPNRAQRE